MAKMSEEPKGGFVPLLVAGGVCLLYAIACLLPCIDCGPPFESSDPGFPDFESGQISGLVILLFGWDGGNNGVPWSANVLLAFGLACLWSHWLRSAFWLGVAASVLGLTTWWVRRYDTLMIGYYVWQASLLLLVGGAAFALANQRGRRCGRTERAIADHGLCTSTARRTESWIAETGR